MRNAINENQGTKYYIALENLKSHLELLELMVAREYFREMDNLGAFTPQNFHLESLLVSIYDIKDNIEISEEMVEMPTKEIMERTKDVDIDWVKMSKYFKDRIMKRAEELDD